MPATFEMRHHEPRLVFDLRDAFAQWKWGNTTPRPVLGPLHIDVVARYDGSKRIPINPIELDLIPNPSGNLIWFGKIRDRRSRTEYEIRDGTFDPDVKYRLRVSVPGKPRSRLATQSLTTESAKRIASAIFASAEFDQYLGPEVWSNQGDDAGNRGPDRQAVQSINLEPGYAYPFRGVDPVHGIPGPQANAGKGPTLLRGSFVSVDGGGISRARIETEVPCGTDAIERKYLTDQTGQWVMWFPDAVFPTNGLDGTAPVCEIDIEFTPQGRDTISVQNVRIVRGREVRLLQTSLRGRAVNVRRLGISGVVITLNGHGESATTDADGFWSIHFPLNKFSDEGQQPTVDIAATSPAGQTIQRDNVPLEPRGSVRIDDFRFEGT